MRIFFTQVKDGAIKLDTPRDIPEGARVTVIVDDDDWDTSRTEEEMPIVDLRAAMAAREDREEAIPQDEIRLAEAPREPAPPPKVLVVEDDPDLREMFAEVLETAGYQVAVAADGREALQHLHVTQRKPSLILLDLRMPNMDGVEFRQLQIADGALAQIPVLVTTADGRVHETVATMDVAGVLPKPLRRADLVAAVEALTEDDHDDDGDADRS